MFGLCYLIPDCMHNRQTDEDEGELGTTEQLITHGPIIPLVWTGPRHADRATTTNESIPVLAGAGFG